MLESFDTCKYINVCKLLNLCMFVVEKLRVIEILWSFDRWNLMLRINICECMNECKNEYMENVNVKNEYMGNVNVKNEHGEC